MNKEENSNYKQFGLIGKNISYSFSPDYFAQKFKALGLKDYNYQTFDLNQIDEIKSIFSLSHLQGLNVTIPYKEAILPYLEELSPAAKSIGAVNTIAFHHNKIIGHNTDYIGFLESIKPLLKPTHKKAMILGTGGANKAVQYALKLLHIPFIVVSRSVKKGDITYDEITHKHFKEHQVIINTTPVGTFPNINDTPPIPLDYISKQHLIYDLIYNPPETKLLKIAKKQKAVTKNGLEMLELQANAAWEIWTNEPA